MAIHQAAVATISKGVMKLDVLTDFLNKLGYEVLTTPMQKALISEWLQWYKGKVEAFHNYTVYNGLESVPKEKKTLGMAKKASEDWADLLFNEKVSITTKQQKILDDVLKKNHFRKMANELIEKTFALGTGAFVEYRTGDPNKPVNIDYINAAMIKPLKVQNGEIIDCAFASEIGDQKYYINIHTLQPNGQYRIENVIFDVKKGEYLINELPQGVKPVAYSAVKMFQIIKPNIANNINLDEPMGLSVYANAVDEMMDIDEKYDSYFNEFEMGKKRIFVDSTLVNVDINKASADECVRPLFDPSDTTFYALNMDKDKGIEQTDFNLRVQEHDQALQTALNLFGDKCGFGSDHYSFTKGSVYTNEAQVISTNSKLFRRLKKHELVLEDALIDLVRAVLYAATNQVYSEEIVIDFDDSIIEDKTTEKQSDRNDVSLGAMSLEEYRSKWYGETIEEAKKKLPSQSEPMA